MFQNDDPDGIIPIEGSAVINLRPAGSGKGPGKKAPVFYNPSMRLNRDMTVLIMQGLVREKRLPGRDRLRILDGLCGTAVKSIRLFREVDWGDLPFEISACDVNRYAMEAAEALKMSNEAEIDLSRMDVKENLHRNRYSFIDIDPFGSPVPYAACAFSSILPRGVIAFTATDTAALSGSIPRVTFRRYGTRMIRTEFLKEMSCRIMMGYLARTAASLGLSIRPLLFYAMDHYVRGFVEVDRGVKRADEMLSDVSMIHHAPPGPPSRGVSNISGAVNQLGPLWMGPLEDPIFLEVLKDIMVNNGSLRMNMGSPTRMEKMIDLAVGEHCMRPFGYDTDILSSRLSASPPPINKVIEELIGSGFKASRSRFGDKIIRTDSDWDPLKKIIDRRR